MSVSRNDLKAQLNIIWEALESHRENCIPEGNDDYDLEWDDICTVMAWWEEELSQ